VFCKSLVDFAVIVKWNVCALIFKYFICNYITNTLTKQKEIGCKIIIIKIIVEEKKNNNNKRSKTKMIFNMWFFKEQYKKNS
jgi:hypothetical protein